ncbi:MAG: hypothetical protein ABSF83_05610 [Nitrososphaerales archaeon]|jgi:hypothetical protein
MNRPLLGAVAGLLLAAALVGCVALVGDGGSLHLDLAGARPASGGSGLAVTVAPSSGSQGTQNSAGEGGTPTTSPSPSSGSPRLENDGSTGLLLLPILLGGALGAVFYGVYARRADAE